MGAKTVSSKAIGLGSKMAPLIGAYAGWMSKPAEAGDFGARLNFIINAAKNFKIADPVKTTTMALAQPGAYPIASGVGLAITGFLIKEAGKAVGISEITGLGRIAYRGGMSAAGNALAASYFYEAQNNPGGGPAGYQAASPKLRNVPTIQIDNPQLLTQQAAMSVDEGWTGTLG